MFDLLFLNARVVDGMGNPWFRADVGIEGKRIAAVGSLKEATAARAVDLGGMVLAPGFIDIHCHSDYTLLVDGRAESCVRMGVTTECIGNCGTSAAPARPSAPYSMD